MHPARSELALLAPPLALQLDRDRQERVRRADVELERLRSSALGAHDRRLGCGDPALHVRADEADLALAQQRLGQLGVPLHAADQHGAITLAGRADAAGLQLMVQRPDPIEIRRGQAPSEERGDSEIHGTDRYEACRRPAPLARRSLGRRDSVAH
jgi:hypothetical protein